MNSHTTLSGLSPLLVASFAQGTRLTASEIGARMHRGFSNRAGETSVV